MRSSKALVFFLSILCSVAAAPVRALDGGIENLRQTGKAFASVARAVSPSVVFIQVEGKASAGNGLPIPFGENWPFGNDFFERFFGDPSQPSPRAPNPNAPPNERRMMGQGSGFIFAAKNGVLSNKSYVLTNNHVVENADKVHVTLQDGREFEAKITGRDAHSDLAVIELAVGGLPVLNFADSSKLEVGEWVVAIGNPFGLSHTLTAGVVSAKGRTSIGINDYEDFIQTDAAINPGNSGGPLVNLSGEAVGINTAIFSRSGGYMGIGFAIPSNLAKTIAWQLIESGEVSRGFLGVVIQPLTQALAESFNVKLRDGILIAEVNDGSPAQQAGLRQGDVVVAMDGEPINDVGSFRNRVALTPPGNRVTLTIVREGKREDVAVTVGKLSADKMAAAAGPGRSTEQAIGLTVQTLTPQLAAQLDAKPGEGVVVTQVEPSSIAALAGINPGAIILQVDRKPVNSVAAFQQAIKSRRGSGHTLLLVRQDGAQRFVALKW